MNRRSFFGFLPAIPFAAAAVKKAIAEPTPQARFCLPDLRGRVIAGHEWNCCLSPAAVNDSARALMADIAKWREGQL